MSGGIVVAVADEPAFSLRSASAAMPRVTAEHEQEVRERIVGAAAHVFAERGFHGATMQDVVRESGLSVGAIYTWFKGKDELFLACCDLNVGQSIGELSRRLLAANTLVERLAVAIAFFLDTVEQAGGTAGPADFLVQAWAEADREPAVREMLARRRTQIATVGEMLIREGMGRGEIPAWVDASALAYAYTALLDGLVMVRRELGGMFRRAEMERQAREILVLLLAANAAKERPPLPEIPAQPFEIVTPHV
jgi:AcrR family transcriptional regulator